MRPRFAFGCRTRGSCLRGLSAKPVLASTDSAIVCRPLTSKLRCVAARPPSSPKLPMIERLSRLLRLEPRETRHGLALGGILFALSCAYTLTKTARDAVFLARISAATLPWVFVVVGLLTSLMAAGWARMIRGRSAGSSLELCAVINAIGLAVFAVLVPFGGRWLPFPLYLWVNAFGLILLAQFWVFANSLADPHEAKRTLGLIGTLGILGGLVGGVLASGISMAGGVAPIVAGGAALCAVVPAMVRHSRHDHAFAEAPASADDDIAAPESSPWKLSYVRWLA